jgi:uncharacterized membrane protein
MVRHFHQKGWLTYLKTLTYALMHFTVAVAVAYAISRNWAVALGIGIIEPLVQTFAYHIHERFWEKKKRTLEDSVVNTRLA